MDTFEKFLASETVDIRSEQYIKEANSEMSRCRELCWRINQTNPAEQDKIISLEKELVCDQGENCFITSPFQIDVAKCLHLGKNVFINRGFP